MICTHCNFDNDNNAQICSNCGGNLLMDNENFIKLNPKEEYSVKESKLAEKSISNKRWSVVLILCIFLGLIGFHRFYVGKGGTAILMLLTLGGFGIWALVDLVIIVLSEFTDEDGRKIIRNKNSILETT